MKWSIKEEEIVCKFYLSHQDSWRANIDVVMNELRVAGFASRDESSTRMRISNIASLHTGVGLANASKQTVAVYNRLK
ncbi:MAG: hypothetical protein WAQ13_03790 [Bacilli bacterium]|jgi:hypothetical protein